MVVLASLVVAGGLFAAAVRRWDRANPARPFPRWRVAAFAAGLVALGVALVGPVDRASGERFSAHMAQHLVLTLVAPPLLLTGRPLTLARRTTGGRGRRAVLAALHARPVRWLTHPVVAWAALPVVLWVTHFTSLYDAAVGSEAPHLLEHALYLSSGLLFWLPLLDVEPSPRRLGHAARVLYVAAALPANALLALVLAGSGRVLYPSYAGPGALSDQQAAAAIMWIGGALLLLVALLGVAAGWARSERATSPRAYSRASPISPSASATAPTASSQGP